MAYEEIQPAPRPYADEPETVGMAKAMEIVDEELSKLGGRVETLINRLDPVLGPQEVLPATLDGQRTHRSRTTGWMLELSDRIHQISSAVDELGARLDLPPGLTPPDAR